MNVRISVLKLSLFPSLHCTFSNEKGADDIEEEGVSKKSVGSKKGSKTTTTND
jgi:hypothetical protein